MRQHKPLIISFYAGAECYGKYADRLRHSCKVLGLETLIMKLDTRLTDWVEITNLKGRFIRKVMREMTRPLLWVDVDAEVLKEPVALYDVEADFGVYAKPRKWKFKPIGRQMLDLPDGWPQQLGPLWFLSGTLYFNNTSGAMELLDCWNIAAKANMRAYEQYQLQECWCETRPNTFWLPECYCQVRRGKPDTVIRHDFASVKQKGVVRA